MKQEFIKRLLSSLILLPLVIYFALKGSILFNSFLIICLLITFYEWNRLSKKIYFKILGFIFLLLSFISVHKLRNEFNSDYEIFFMIIIICVSTDIGGYFFGKLFGGPKLTKLSPKKTYSGMVGGFLLSIIFTKFYLSYFLIGSNIIPNNIIIFIFLASLVSQMGDIFISYFKRSAKLKDTGKIIPGHGGLLDRIDGMIFTFPFAYIILSMKILH